MSEKILIQERTYYSFLTFTFGKSFTDLDLVFYKEKHGSQLHLCLQHYISEDPIHSTNTV